MANNEISGMGGQLGGKRDEDFNPFKTEPGSMADKMKVRQLSPLGGGSGASGMTEEELIKMGTTEAMVRMMMGQGESGRSSELLSSPNPEWLRTGVRQLEGIGAQSIVLDETPPHGYEMERTAQVIRETAKMVVNLKNGIGRCPDRWKQVISDDTMAVAVLEAEESMAKEINAYRNLMEHMKELIEYGDDEEQLLFGRFTSPRKQRVFSEQLGTMFRAEASREGGVKFGDMVQEALRVFRDIGEGKCVVTLDAEKDGVELYSPIVEEYKVPGTEEVRQRVLCDDEGEPVLQEVPSLKGTVPNIYAQPFNRGLFELIIKKAVVEPQVDAISDPWKKKLEAAEAEAAGYMGYVISRILGFGPKYSLGTAEGRTLKPESISAEDMQLMNLGTDKATADAKLRISVRQASEFSGLKYKDPTTGESVSTIDPNTGRPKVSREHPRAVGAPVVIGCYPDFVATLFEELSIKVRATHQWNSDHNRWEALSPGINRFMEVSIDEAVYGKGYMSTSTGKEYVFEQLTLDKIPWGEVRYYSEGVSVKKKGPDVANLSKADRIMGGTSWKEGKKLMADGVNPALTKNGQVDSDAPESSHQLLRFYAFRVFKEVVRTDFAKQLQEIVEGDKLISLNKTIDVAVGLLCKAYRIDDELTVKLGDYIRVVFLGGVVVASTRDSDSSIPTSSSMVVEPKQTLDAGSLLTMVIKASAMARFLPNDPKSSKVSGWAVNLLNYIVRERKSPTPFELIEGGDLSKQLKISFSDTELKKLSPLYPLSKYP